MDWSEIAKVVLPAVTTAALGWTEGTFKWGKTAIARLRGRTIEPSRLRPPRRSLRMLQTSIRRNENVFTLGQVSDPDDFPKTVPTLHCRLHLAATNLTQFNIAVIGYEIRLSKRQLRKSTRTLHSHFGDFEPPSFEQFSMRGIEFRFDVTPPPIDADSIEVDFCLIDQFGNRHWLKHARIRKLK